MEYNGEHYDELVLFKGIPYDEVKDILNKGTIQELDGDEFLLRPGQINTFLFQLLEGKVGILFTDTVSETVVEIMPGSCIGELSIIDNKEATAYVKAYRKSKLLVIDQESIWKLISTSERFVINLLKLFSQRMRYNTEALAESLFVNTVPDIIYRLDKDGNFLFLNIAVEKLGFKVDELLGQPFSRLLSDEDIEKVSYKFVVDKIRRGKVDADLQPKLFDERRAQDRKTKGLEVNLRSKDSIKAFPAEINPSFSSQNLIGEVSCTGINKPDPSAESFHYAGTIGIIRDITEKKHFENQLKEQKARIEAVFDTAADAIIVINADGIIESHNHATETMFDYLENELVGMNISTLIPSDLWNNSDRSVLKKKSGGSTVCESLEAVGCSKDGSQFPLELSLSEVRLEHRVIFTVILRDITERKKAEQIIYRQANYDTLTDLPNRSLFIKRLEASVNEAREKGSKMAIMFVDLDRFKWVNDTMGHAAGDALLKEVARRLNACVKKGTVARLGGDEFTAIIPGITGQGDVSTIAKDMLERLNQGFMLEGGKTYISGSVGISIFPDDAEDMEGLMKRADEAMYRLKDAGRNGYYFFDGESFVIEKDY